jgi:hypothetical protein
VAGPAGAIEVARDLAQGLSRGLAFVSHPHPLFGGTLDNKVVQTLARAFVQLGWRAVRFNFRGVGASQGAWDEGRGEVDDALALGGSGGVIVMDLQGQPSFAMTSSGMYRGAASNVASAAVAIYGDEALRP